MPVSNVAHRFPALLLAMAAATVTVDAAHHGTGEQSTFLVPTSVIHTPTVLPVPNATKSFWIANLNTDTQTPSLTHGSDGELTTDADVCIIGSGITGVSAAYHLARIRAEQEVEDRLKIVILDAREFCSGATGRNGGHLAPHAFLSFKAVRDLYGLEEARRAVDIERYTDVRVRAILADAGKTADVDLVSRGRVILLFTKEEEDATHADYDAAMDAGVDLTGVRWIDREEVFERYGASCPAVLIPANNLWPHKLVSTLYNLAASSPHLALSLHTLTAVTALSPSASRNRRWDLHTPRGRVACHTVLHATNGYASHLLPFMHAPGPLSIVPTRGQIIAMRANTPWPFGVAREGFTANGGSEYWFPRPKQDEELELVILGGGRHAAERGLAELFETDDSVLDPRVSAFVREFLPRVFPGRFDEGREPEMEWTGIMGYTESGEPSVGPVLDPSDSTTSYAGQYIAAGYTGHGMPRAFACAEAVAGMILTELDGASEQWTPPAWFPVHYLTNEWTRWRVQSPENA